MDLAKRPNDDLLDCLWVSAFVGPPAERLRITVENIDDAVCRDPSTHSLADPRYQRLVWVERVQCDSGRVTAQTALRSEESEQNLSQQRHPAGTPKSSIEVAKTAC